MNTYFQGIDGLGQNGQGHGRLQSWGAVVSIGQKSPAKGFPTDTDKFFIKRPQATSKKIAGRSVLVRENDPDFERFNLSDRPELRSAIRFTVVHPTHLRDGWDSMIDSFHFSLVAQQLPKHPSHPKLIPVCIGNGKKARRWDQRKNDFVDLKCPNHLCEFRQGKPAPCKPSARMAFQIRWEQHQPWANLPTPFVKFETKSWYNLDKVILPFWLGLHHKAIQLGFSQYTFYGLPVILKLGKRSAGKGSLVPAVSLSTDFQNGETFRDFLLKQAQTKAQIELLHAPSIVEDNNHDETGETE